MKQVLKISLNGKFSQYLKKSEVRYINDIAKHGVVTVELVNLSIEEYNIFFDVLPGLKAFNKSVHTRRFIFQNSNALPPETFHPPITDIIDFDAEEKIQLEQEKTYGKGYDILPGM